MQIGKVYHQQFENGDRLYAKIVSRFANGNFKALCSEGGRRKPVTKSVVDHESLLWRETPAGEIPKTLR
jgi:hypothetical protein